MLADRALQTSAVVATSACFLIVLGQLNARIASDPDAFVQGSVAPFEWAGVPPGFRGVEDLRRGFKGFALWQEDFVLVFKNVKDSLKMVRAASSDEEPGV